MKKLLGILLIMATVFVVWFGIGKWQAIENRDTVNELKRLIKGTYPNNHFVDIQYPYTKGEDDALVIFLTTTGANISFSSTSNVAYFQRTNGGWKEISLASLSDEELGWYEYWNESIASPRIYHGTLSARYYDELPKNIWVNDQKAHQVKYNKFNEVYWYAFEEDFAQVVAEYKNGEFERLDKWHDTSGDMYDEPIPSISKYIETIGKEFVYEYTGDSMNYLENEYSQYPLVIIPRRNIESLWQSDALLVEKENGDYTVVRLFAREGMEVEIRNGQIISSWIDYDKDAVPFVGLYTDTMYYAKMDGYDSKAEYEMKEGKEASAIFTLTMPSISLGENEYFVAPDNWESDSIFGVITEEQIVGKVKGYYRDE